MLSGRLRLFAIAALLSSLMAPHLAAQTTDMIKIPYVEAKLLDWGHGYDSRTFTARSTQCVEGTIPTADWTYHIGEAALRTVESARDIENKLDLKISDSVK